MIADVMVASGVAFNDLKRLAVSLGPGSFTGVRTGISVARALALAAALPVVGTTSLHVMALQVAMSKPNRTIIVAMQTRGGLLYCQTFSAGATVARCAPWLATPEQAAAALDSPTIAAGSGAALVAFAAHQVGIDCETALDVRHPDAIHLARIASGLSVLNPPQPIYVRDADALPQSGTGLLRSTSSPR